MKSILEGVTPIDIIRSLIDDTKFASSGGEYVGRFLLGPGSKDQKRYQYNRDRYLGGSISNYASDLIMTFPMLIDNSLSPELCSMLSKASERNIVTMLHLLFSSMQFNGKDGREIIKSIYGKVKTNMSMDDYIDTVSNFVDSLESYGPGYINNDKETNRLINETVKAICQCVKECKIYLPAFSEDDSINEMSLNDYTVMKNHNGDTVVKEVKKPVINSTPYDMVPEGPKYTMYRTDPVAPSDIDNIRNWNDVEYKRWQMNQALAKQKADAELAKANARNQSYQHDMEVINRRILDTDVKKANELQPTLMVVSYNELDTNGQIKSSDSRRSFVCGVKSRLIPVDSNDIIERIVSKNRTRLSFLNLIRATTKEISLLKDFILCLDQAKADARNSVKKGESAQIWKALEVMSTKNNLNQFRRNGNDASAITTLVVSKETANLMNKQFRIDIEQPKVAKMILDKYNLLAIFIVDESIEIVKTLYRGNDMFDQQAFSYLEREENDKSYKKVINLIGQMNR